MRMKLRINLGNNLLKRFRVFENIIYKYVHMYFIEYLIMTFCTFYILYANVGV